MKKEKILKNSKKIIGIISLAILLSGSFTFAAWQGTSWILSGEPVYSTKLKDNFNYLYNLWRRTGNNLYYTAGNVGIGTTSPGVKLDVKGSSGESVAKFDLVSASADTILELSSDDGVIAGGSNFLKWSDGGTVLGVIRGDGNVGIGTSSPYEKLHVSGIVLAGDTAASNGSTVLAGNYNGDNDYLLTLGSIRSTGGTTLGFGVKPSATTAGGYASATSINIARGALTIDASGTHFLHAGSQAVAQDSDISMTEHMTIASSGNVGIGTTSPGAKLDVVGNTELNGKLNIYSYGNTHFDYGSNHDNYLTYGSAGKTYFRTYDGSGYSNKVVIDENGNVGIGTTSPSHKLDVNGNIRTLGRSFFFGTGTQRIYGDNGSAFFVDSNNDTGTQMIFRDKQDKIYGRVYGGGDGQNFGLMDGDGNWSYLASKDNYTEFRINDSTKLRINSNGNVGIGTTAPSSKLEVAGNVEAEAFCDRNGQNCSKASDIYNVVVGGGGGLWTQGSGDNIYRQNGNVGIGTTNPNRKLSVIGDILIQNNNSNSGWAGLLEFKAPNSPAPANKSNFKLINYNNSTENYLEFRSDNDDGSAANANILVLKHSGNVGIGTTSPITKLDVNGITRTKGLIFDNQVAAHQNNDGVLYRYGGQAYLTVDDNFYLRDTNGDLSFRFITGDSPNLRMGTSTTSGWNSIWMYSTPATKTLRIHGMGDSSNQLRFGRHGNNYGSWEANPVTFDMDAPSHTLFVHESGGVGIGTASPAAKLHVNGAGRFDGGVLVDGRWMISGDGAMHRAQYPNNDHYGYFEVRKLDGTRGGYFGYGNGSSTLNLYLDNASRLDITGGNVYMSGNVGIGTTSPSEKLHVNGNVKATAYYYTSDKSLKENIKTTKGLDAILKLRGVDFVWKENKEKSVGLVAQEVEKVLPELVKTDKSTGLKSVLYGNLVAPLIEAVKDLYAELVNLKEKVAQIFERQNTQEQRIKELERDLKEQREIIKGLQLRLDTLN